jgi:exodeoxyribonuclease VII small subunit
MPTSDAPSPGGDDDIAMLSFDKALDELRAVVARLEEGGLPLEESIALYERGAALHEHCGRLLDSAELRVQRLVDSAGGGTPRVMDLQPDDGDDL